jgi:hypothetical protein
MEFKYLAKVYNTKLKGKLIHFYKGTGHVELYFHLSLKTPQDIIDNWNRLGSFPNCNGLKYKYKLLTLAEFHKSLLKPVK